MDVPEATRNRSDDARVDDARKLRQTDKRKFTGVPVKLELL